MPVTALPANVEYKTFHFEIKSVDADQGIVRGYLSTFNNVDYGYDRVIPGAFTKTIKDRKSAKNKKGLWPLLWMHDAEKPIGLCIDAVEDKEGLDCTFQLDISTNAQGIPNNPLAVMVFSGFKQDYVNEFSMGYKAITVDYSKVNGYDRQIRDLKEVQVWEASACTSLQAMNDQAQVTGVKSLDGLAAQKSASGDTTFPLASQDEAWDGSAAHKSIVAWATSDDGSLDEGKMKSVHFWYDASSPDKVTSYKMPFCIIRDGKPVAIPRGIFACAGAVQGARSPLAIPDADVAGVKSKIAKYYKQLDMTPPWEDNGKVRRAMPTTQTQETKDFNDHYREHQIQSWLSSFDDLVCALYAASMDIFNIGDTPQTDDITTILDDGNGKGFISEYKAWVAQGVALDASNYLNNQSISDNIMYLMRRSISMDTKAGAQFSQESKDKIMEQCKALGDIVEQHKSMIDMHKGLMTKSKTVAEDLSHIIGSPAYAGNDQQGQQSAADGKRRGPSIETPARTPEHQPEPSTDPFEVQIAAWLAGRGGKAS